MASISQAAEVRTRIHLQGIVQGVGFRPFVFNLVKKLGLRGFVLNSTSGVDMELEGEQTAIQQFLETLKQDPPPLALIESIDLNELPLFGYSDFIIRESVNQENQFALVSPDVGTCADCLKDFTDPANRRFGYPFTNCTNCGPRFTIIRDIPYDRPFTTMAAFEMCQTCLAEYHDPTDRRFHAQPNACSECGPGLSLVQSGGSFSDIKFATGASSLSILAQVRGLLHEGQIIAIRGMGGFHLACDASNAKALTRLRQRKRRSDKPFAVMVPDIGVAEALCAVTPGDREALLSLQRPIVILRRHPEAALPAEIAPGNNTLGVMLPYTPLHYLIFGESPGAPEFPALVMTSGNLNEEPIVIQNEEAWQRLSAIADWLLFHNRDIYMRVDDSVVRSISGQSRVGRRSRGHAPFTVDLKRPMHPILGSGAELKNTFCLTKDRYAILSQHIGDLENYETLRFFEESLHNLKKLFRVEPATVAYDLHPQYMSTRFALQTGLPSVGVQHHHAHVASCMAENGLCGPVIGVALDGTGYGTDGQIWGGEFLEADFSGFERRAHFRYIPLAGGDAAIRQPWRSALSYLRDAFGADIPDGLPAMNAIPVKEFTVVDAMLRRKFSVIQTSSCGRLFDAVASILGLRQRVTFEGQAAIELECLAGADDNSYPFEISPSEEVDFRSTIQATVRDFRASERLDVISARFHNTVVDAIVETCRRIRASGGLKQVCLSGGVFQNKYLTERSVEHLRGCGFEVFLHSRVPANDGGIALGQVAIANAVLQRGDTYVSGNSR